MCLHYYEAPLWYVNFLYYGNLVFVIVFVLEATIKMLGLGIYQYFHSKMNVFDFFLVVGSLIG